MNPKNKKQKASITLAGETALSPVLTQFKEALLNNDMGMLSQLLHDQYTYLDGLSKKQALEWFSKQFALEIPKSFTLPMRTISFAWLAVREALCQYSWRLFYYHLGFA